MARDYGQRSLRGGCKSRARGSTDWANGYSKNNKSVAALCIPSNFAASAWADYQREKTPGIEKRVEHILETHPKSGPGVFPNETASHPFEGDFILEVLDRRRIMRLWYYVDEPNQAV